MEEMIENVKSGKDLCDEFFNDISKRDDIDLRVRDLVKSLYDSGNLTPTKLNKSLKVLRQEQQNAK